MKDRKVKIGLIQMRMGKVKAQNLAKAVLLIKKAAKKGAKIVCLPELFNTLYFPQAQNDKGAFKLAEIIPGKTTKFLGELAKKLEIILVVPLYENYKGNY